MAGRFIAKWIAALSLALAAIYFLLRSYDHSIRLRAGSRPIYAEQRTDIIKPAVELPVEESESLTSSTSTIPPLYTSDPDTSEAQTYNRTLVISRVKNETVDWISQHLSTLPSLRTCIYTVDDPSAPYTVPANKGHEVMPYLTYIITHYDNLTAVTMFLHAHRVTWHNNDLLGSDAVRMIKRLRPSYVLDGGYINMRCHQDPGCPDHLHPATTVMDINRKEEVEMAQAWGELFPGYKVPDVLSQPCCSQFALSRNKIRSIPLSQYETYRDWLLKTDYADEIAGRIWEYVWQYLFLGKQEYCPSEHRCYCDGYGVCFRDEEEYGRYFEMRKELRSMEKEYDEFSKKAAENPEGGWLETGRAREVVPRFREVKGVMDGWLEGAFKRGRELGVSED